MSCSICREKPEKDLIDVHTGQEGLEGIHCFHRACLNAWIKSSRKLTCPLCQQPFPTEFALGLIKRLKLTVSDMIKQCCNDGTPAELQLLLKLWKSRQAEGDGNNEGRIDGDEVGEPEVHEEDISENEPVGEGEPEPGTVSNLEELSKFYALHYANELQDPAYNGNFERDEACDDDYDDDYKASGFQLAAASCGNSAVLGALIDAFGFVTSIDHLIDSALESPDDRTNAISVVLIIDKFAEINERALPPVDPEDSPSIAALMISVLKDEQLAWTFYALELAVVEGQIHTVEALLERCRKLGHPSLPGMLFASAEEYGQLHCLELLDGYDAFIYECIRKQPAL